MKNRQLFLIVFAWLFVTNTVAQQQFTSAKDTATTWQLFKYDVGTTFKGVKHSVLRPLHWKGKDFAKLGGLVGGTMLLSLADESVNDFFVNNQEGFPQGIRDFGWYFGSPQNYFMANAALYGVGLFTKNENIRRTSVLIITSSITTGLFQTITKNAVGRARPSSGYDHDHYRLFSKESGFHAFPSGHTILSVTMAHSIAKQFDNIWAKIGIYAVGAIPPISRLHDEAHWLTDVAFSAALSVIVVDCVDNFLFNTKAYKYPEHQKQKKISWNLKFGANQIGIVGTF